MPEGLECWHVEVQISYRPVGYIGGDTSARRRTPDQLRAGVVQWVEKKFTSLRKIQRRNEILPGAQWRNFLVHAVLKDEAELPLMQELGVELIPYRQVLLELCNDTKSSSSSAASGIIEMLNHLR